MSIKNRGALLMSVVDWPTLVLNLEWLKKLDLMALRRFTQPGLAEEASAYVIERLSEDDWAACMQYSGNAKPETYLMVLSQNFIEEFSRKRFGRPRPPTWLKREGELWVTMWKMLCLERQMLPKLLDTLQSSTHSRHYLESIHRTIKARLPWCGDSHREIPTDCLIADDDNTPEIEDESLEKLLDAHQWEDALHVLYRLLLTEECPSTIFDTQLKQSVNALRSKLALEPQERLLLKMVYQEGLKMNVIADALHMPRYQPGRLLKALHARIREALSEVTINFEELPFRD